MPNNTFDNDYLGREKYAKSILDFIESYTKITDRQERRKKKGTDNDALVIGISASCGKGKTVFLSMFEEYLKTCFKSNEHIHYSLIHYDAWKHDYYTEDALEPLCKTILDSDIVKEIIKNRKRFDRAVLKAHRNLLSLKIVGAMNSLPGIELGKELGPSRGNDSSDFFDELDIYLCADNYNKNFIRKYNMVNLLIRALEEVQFAIKNSTDSKNADSKRVLFIIDELDRCKPSFAVQTLEIIKHLFNINGLVFVFAFDIMQLSATIKKYYGENFDAVGYLTRFFDYITYMPEGDKASFIEKCLQEYNLRLEDIGVSSCNITQSSWNEKLMQVCNYYSLSPRDIKIVLSNFETINRKKLGNNKNINAKLLYFYFLAMKYKNPDMLIDALEAVNNSGDTFGGADGREKMESFLEMNPIPFFYNPPIVEVETSYREIILSKRSINEITGAYLMCRCETGMWKKKCIIDMEVKNMELSQQGDLIISGKHYDSDETSEEIVIADGDNSSLSFVIYSYDLYEIKKSNGSSGELKPLEYIQRVLEAYDG